jgi:hypothetical protein|tara:strand:+ start:163 stop:327 length:165 start_codon:yes stop_codon:yes gene_type:complete
MTSKYRGISYNPSELETTKRKSFEGIYRGQKHGAIENVKSTQTSGVYRGVKWVA